MADPLWVDRETLAAVLDVTPRHVTNLEKDHGMPSGRQDGRRRVWDLKVVGPWFYRYTRNETRSTPSDLEAAKAEKARLDIRRQQIELDRLEGRSIDVDDHRRAVAHLADGIRAAIVALPTWGPRIVGIRSAVDGAAMMRDVANHLLREMRRVGEGMRVATPDTELPDDFPGVRPLRAAGVETVGDLLGLDDVGAVKGIGAKTRRKIQRALSS